MNGFSLILRGTFLSLLCLVHESALSQDAAIERKIDALLKQMTIEEKVGQLHQVSIKNIDTPSDKLGPKPATAAVLADVKNGRTGSVINVKGVVDTRRMQAMALQSRLKIPLLFSLDVIHGYKTIFPIPLAESASWDLAAIEETAHIAATEAAASGIHWTFAPMVDIARDPRWGRIMEGAGEDSFLASLVAAARVRGFQGKKLGDVDRVMACAKHFAAYGAAIGGHDYNAVDMSEQQLHEVYLPPFKAALDAGVATFMNAFNTLNGVPATADKTLQRSILKGAWGFNGFTVSDWDSIPEMVAHGYATDVEDAAIKAINAGSDMDMEGKAYSTQLVKAVSSGKVDIAVIDDAVRRVLRKKFEIGLFDDPYKFSDVERERAALTDPSHIALARDMARKSLVLLKNDHNTLPLRKDFTSIAVIGPLASSKLDLQGAWSNLVKSDLADVVTVVEGIKNHVSPSTTVAFAQGCDINCSNTDDFKNAVDVAQKADVIILVLGEAAKMTGEARSRAEINLPGKQNQLFEVLKATGKPVIAVMMAGRPIIFNEVSDHAAAILFAWFPGNQGGNAIADILFGDYNPAGRLTVSFPRSIGQIPVAYQQFQTGKPLIERQRKAYMDLPNSPRYAFGYGQTYTEFSYTDLKISKASLRPDEKLTVSFNLTNTGKRSGDEVVQLYLRDYTASLVRPIKELKGFQKISLQPGQTSRISFDVDKEMLSFVNGQLHRVAEPGRFKLMLGSASDDIKLSADVELLEK